MGAAKGEAVVTSACRFVFHVLPRFRQQIAGDAHAGMTVDFDGKINLSNVVRQGICPVL